MQGDKMEKDVLEEVVDLQEEVIAEEEIAVEEDESEKEETAEPQKQSEEDNSKFAEIRRKYEAEKKELLAQLEAEKKARKERVDEVVQTAFKGSINPYNNKTIETEEDYEEYQRMYREDTLEQLGFSKDYIEKEIERNPIIKEAKEIIETQKQYKARMEFNEKLAEITKLNPDIKTVEDLIKMPNVEEFNDYVLNKGYDLVDAYRLVADFPKRKASTAEQKEHLIKAGGNAGGTIEKEIPKSLMSFYKETWPNETQAQLRARYNKILKRQGE